MSTPSDTPDERPEHPAVARLRAAIAAALKGRERKLTELVEHDRKRAARASASARWEPNFGPHWRDYARDAHDLSAHASGAVSASPEAANTALSILQVLSEAATARGWSVKAIPDGYWLVLSGEEMKVRATVRERFQPSEFRRDTPTGPVTEKGKTGTGRFTLVVGGTGLTELKIEGTPAELEQKIQAGAVFERMRQRRENAMRQEVIEAARRQERERRAAEATAAREEEERRRVAAALEAERRQMLASEAAAWEEAERIRRYVSHVMAAGGHAAWGEWALQVADDMDPTVCHHGDGA